MSKTSYTLISGIEGIKSLPAETFLGIDRSLTGNNREGLSANGRFLTSEQLRDQRDLSYTYQVDLRSAAIVCIYCLCERVSIYFPTSTAAKPSGEVLVVLVTPAREDHKAYFPFTTDWRHWQYGIIPVLEDPAFSMKAPLNKNLFNTDFESLVRYFENGLVESFRSAGFIP